MADGENVDSLPTCKFCKKSAINKRVKCKNCATYFHNSCATKKTRKCCDNESLSAATEIIAEAVISQSVGGHVQYSKSLSQEDLDISKENISEVVYLKRLIMGLEAQNALLHENCQYWKSRATSAEEKVSKQKQTLQFPLPPPSRRPSATNQLTLTTTAAAITTRPTPQPVLPKTLKPQTGQSTSGANAPSINPPSRSNSVAALSESDADDVIGRTKENGSDEFVTQKRRGWNRPRPNLTPNHNNNTENNWKIRLQRNKANRKVGTKIPDGDLEASKPQNAPKRIWLFVSGIKLSITEKNVMDYIRKNANNVHEDEIEVKLCEVKNSNKSHQSFMVGVNPNLKELVYAENFWPAGISFQRFNFSLGRNFLGKNQQKPLQTT